MSIGKSSVILGIESSCDETAAAVLVDGMVRSNSIAGQEVHSAWGGVVPELASRAHQEHIIPVVADALKSAGVGKEELTAVAFTQGPGLMGALLVGTCFARSLAQGLNIPLIAVDHVRAHVMAHFIRDGVERPVPRFPFMNLTVSGGHTQLVLVRSPLDMSILGTTLDDAAGEAFDKGAKVLGLPYPGGPLVDRYAKGGDPKRFKLPVPQVEGLDMSFSGVKTAFRNLVMKGEREEPGFTERERADLCASLQQSIVDILLRKLQKAARLHGVSHIGIAGGVSANSALRTQVQKLADREGWQAHIPPFAYCTDNAAMIAQAGLFLYEAGITAGLDTVPVPRW
jgi:N6-L-threonylcarbamoyladenine synthase